MQKYLLAVIVLFVTHLSPKSHGLTQESSGQCSGTAAVVCMLEKALGATVLGYNTGTIRSGGEAANDPGRSVWTFYFQGLLSGEFFQMGRMNLTLHECQFIEGLVLGSQRETVAGVVISYETLVANLQQVPGNGGRPVLADIFFDYSVEESEISDQDLDAIVVGDFKCTEDSFAQ